MLSSRTSRFIHKFLPIIGTILLIFAQYLVLAEDDPPPQPAYNENPAFRPNSVHSNYGFSAEYFRYNYSQTPVIIWWTKALFPHFNGNTATIHCDLGTCISTTDKKKKRDPATRGFIFYGTDFRAHETPLPRQPHHEWALLHEESPMNNYILSHQPMLQLFNHTGTFRRESDYPLTLQHLPSLSYLTSRDPVPLHEKNRLKDTAGLASVAYIQSHCGVASDRDSYVQELMKYIKVDSLGKCLHNKELPEELQNTLTMEEDGFFSIIANYKFHIAFENGICRDYMTEKLFRPLHLGVVPIYWGSEAAKDWMPNDHSIILKDDFASPKELAEYITFLDQNDEEYEKFLEYRQPGGITNTLLVEEMERRPWGLSSMDEPNFINGFECHVCDRILERLDAERLHAANPGENPPPPPPRLGQYTHMGCPQPTRAVDTQEPSKPGNEWLAFDWVNDFWGTWDMAMALKQMIQAGEKDSRKLFDFLEKMHGRH
ncbi:PREDICTED: alpha-(1,3)-fucosyltransferase 11-like [Branchiostoma belcheri]|uniref:Fucosyltransferase n=1 Tax=Branchiostoma belcheri TaxID=7741 RepID=A0A6P5ACK5_BRABE|nr:PREDICTED: alpha-(1,3)-fucosyltransferase 11-like [Branchiostoma belcheri]